MSLPAGQQGLKILGGPVGQPEFVRSFLERKSEEHSTLFELLLLMCASTSANYCVRCVRPCQRVGNPENHTRPSDCQHHNVIAVLHVRIGTHDCLQVKGGGALGKLGRASPRCENGTPQWQAPWCKGWPGTQCFSAVRTCVTSLTETWLEDPS